MKVGFGAAILSGARRGEGGAVRDAAGGAEEAVAANNVWGVDVVLVRAREQDDLPVNLQKSPVVGIPLQTHHSEQVKSTP